LDYLEEEGEAEQEIRKGIASRNNKDREKKKQKKNGANKNLSHRGQVRDGVEAGGEERVRREWRKIKTKT